MIKAQELRGCKKWVGLLSAAVAAPVIVGVTISLDANLFSHVALAGAAVGGVSLIEIKDSLARKRELEPQGVSDEKYSLPSESTFPVVSKMTIMEKEIVNARR